MVYNILYLPMINGGIIMIQIAIVDDDKTYCDELVSFCKSKMEEKCIPFNIEAYESGNIFLDQRKCKHFHGIFLDVEMEGQDGIAVKEILEREEDETCIIFVSSHTEIMQEAFGKNVYAFLEKPVDIGKIEKVLNKIIHVHCLSKKIYIPMDNIEIGTNKSKRKIIAKDILYITSNHVYTDIYMSNGECLYTIRKSLCEWEAELTEFNGFYRIHRSYLIHMKHIKKIKYRKVIMSNNQQINIGRNKIDIFCKAYNDYKKSEARYL